MPIAQTFKGEKIPIKSWCATPESGAIDQAKNLAALPFAVGHIALMPDTHLGYGMPVGGVLATDGQIIVNAVGVDIGCFVGDTLIPLLNGTQESLRNLANNEKTIWVYSINSDGFVVPGKAKALKTRLNAPLIEVVISGGTKIICTPDHQFLMRDGTYRTAESLKYNDSLMPLLRTYETREGYEHIMNPGGLSTLTHKMVSKFFGLKGPVIHHIDGNHFNNTPENLQSMTPSEHSTYHRKHGIMVFRDDDFKRKRLDVLREKGFFAESLLPKKQKVAITNLKAGETTHPQSFAKNYADAGKRGRLQIIKNNTSSRICESCGEVLINLSAYRWHMVKKHNNHKVISVRSLDHTEDVFCLQVETHHNFALAAGVFVHNCGMGAVNTHIPISEVPKDKIKEIMGLIRGQVPLGFNKHESMQDEEFMPRRMVDNLSTLPIITREYNNARKQVGTLGGGNHFLELQRDEDDILWIMIHSGSRNLGKQVADFYNKEANRLNALEANPIPPSWELAPLSTDSEAGKAYLREMEGCVAFAFSNRQLMMHRIQDAVSKITGYGTGQFAPQINIAHNYAALETHFGKSVWVHRKGATRAFKGQVGIIPGSQGTASYIVEGLGNEESFGSCSHGAGRKMGRNVAKRTLNLAEELQKMAELGVIHGIRTNAELDEAPGSYKDIDVVMEEQSDLATIVRKLLPVAVIKG